MAATLPLTTQNDPANLAKQAAARVWYGEAARLAKWRFGGVVVLPVLAGLVNTVWTLLFPDIRPDIQSSARSLTALVALILWFLDEILLRPFIERLRRQAATAQEMFDTAVLDISWNSLLVGERPPVADITKASEALLKKPGQKEQLINWYRPELLGLEASLGRVMAQRMNVWWDRDLRETYVWLLILPCLLLLVLPFWLVLVNRSVADAVLILACLLPASRALWLAIGANRAAIQRLAVIFSHANRLRDECKRTPLSGERAEREARQMQDAIFVHRSSVPVGLQWVYQRSRESNEAAYAAEIADVRRQASW